MDVGEFLERVEGALLWHEYQLDEQLNNQAWYTANLMMSQGNMKKGTKVMDLKKGLYKSLEDVATETRIAPKKDAHAERAKLMQRFGIDASTI